MKNLPSKPKTAEQSSRIKAAMTKSFIFNVLSEEETDRVILALAEVDKMPGDVIIKEGAAVDGTESALFILETGKADVRPGASEALPAHPPFRSRVIANSVFRLMSM